MRICLHAWNTSRFQVALPAVAVVLPSDSNSTLSSRHYLFAPERRVRAKIGREKLFERHKYREGDAIRPDALGLANAPRILQARAASHLRAACVAPGTASVANSMYPVSKSIH